MILVQQIEIRPKPTQVSYLEQLIGHSRFVWNQSLAFWETRHEQGLKTTKDDLQLFFKQLRKDHSFLGEQSASGHREAALRVHAAHERFFKKLSDECRRIKLGRIL